MFKKIHIRLTVLFTAISMLIMIAMSAFYIVLDYKNLYINAMYVFENNLSTLTVNFENKSSISYNMLMNFQNSYKYMFYVYDNDIPFQFTTDTKTKEQLEFIEVFKKQYHEKNSKKMEKAFKAVHDQTIYKNGKEQYYAGIILIPGHKSDTEIYIIYPLDSLKRQFRNLLLRFVMIILFTTIALFVFSWFFTRRLLRPIHENQQSQARFIAAASYEIRNPVNTISSALNAMGKADESQRQEFIKIAKNESKRLSLLTTDLLMLARSDSHSFSVSFNTADLATIILESYEAFFLPAREKKISLSVELPEDSLIADNIDSERIKEVLAILLDNAISYTDEGGRIIIRCSQTAKEFILDVIDNGIGIDAADKQNIFERFYRADKSRENNSHFGLGLCIAKEIIKLHNGHIEVRDTKGGGSTFRITLFK